MCSGYAETFNLLMDMIGVDCITVSGYEPAANGGEGHAWNMVKANGTDNSNWAHIDATYGAGRSTKNKADHTYFMRSDCYMNTLHLSIFTEHKNPASYPSADESANSKIDTETDAIKYMSGYTGAHSHVYSETSTVAACTTAGYTKKQCIITGCDYSLYSNITAPIGHTLEESATCTSGVICTKCDGEYGEPNLDNHYFCKGICVRCKLAIGDIDMDGVITPLDLTLQRRMISGQEPLAMTYIDAVTKGGYCYCLADLDRDGVLSSMDAANMPRLIVGNYTPPCDNAENCPYH